MAEPGDAKPGRRRRRVVALRSRLHGDRLGRAAVLRAAEEEFAERAPDRAVDTLETVAELAVPPLGRALDAGARRFAHYGRSKAGLTIKKVICRPPAVRVAHGAVRCAVEPFVTRTQPLSRWPGMVTWPASSRRRGATLT